MRTRAFIVVLAVTFVAGCGDSSLPATPPDMTPDDICASSSVDGQICGKDKICRSNMCVASTCGDGVVVTGEDCDGGPGCKADCTFQCTDDPATQCAATAPACQKFACKADHTCEVVVDEAANLKPCDQSNAANVCVVGACKAAPVCGNGIQELGEECDDGNSLGLDGCNRCTVEQFAHVTSLVQQFGTDAFCARNALGVAIPTAAARDFIQQTWSFPVASGDLSLVFEFLGAIDPAGVRSTFNLGFIDTVPIRFNQQDDGTFADNYNGASDLDWWYTLRDPDSVDPNGTPRVQLPGEITNRHLTAGPGTIENLRLLFALAPATVKLFNVHIDATLDTKLSKPLVSMTGVPPGHLVSEHESPDFSTFESSGVASALGGMCSDVSARSLAEASLGLLLACADPADPTGSTAAFGPDNHLLDAFVFGCQLFSTDPDTNLPGFVPTIAPAQPDGSLDGSTYTFVFDPVTHQVTSCTKDGSPDDDLGGCLANATYSSYFKIAADRVIVRAGMPAILPLP
jgi:cysteine-rich repeat protein